mmetsp:Transcript_4856/g.10249  ORF Transcript_4856/g.10249 Transcript_4856/m.10249 type:complete len:293 (-) Transcript_4856:195-1073(-)
MLLLCLLCVELPQREKSTLAILEPIRLILPVLVIFGDVLVRVLVHHSLHNLRAQSHRLGVDGVVILLLRVLIEKRSCIFLLVLGRGVLLRKCGLLLFHHFLALEVIRVAVKDLPLRNRLREVGSWRRFGSARAITQLVVEGLRSSLTEVELIAQLGVTQLFVSISLRLCRLQLLDGILFSLLSCHNTLGFVSVFVKKPPFHLKMHRQLLNRCIQLELLLLVAVADDVLGSVGVVTLESTSDLLSEIFVFKVQLIRRGDALNDGRFSKITIASLRLMVVMLGLIDVGRCYLFL